MSSVSTDWKLINNQLIVLLLKEKNEGQRWKELCWRNTVSCSLWWFCSGTHRLPSGHLTRCRHCRAGTSPWRCPAVSETLETFCSQDHREEKWGECHYAHKYSTQPTLFVYVTLFWTVHTWDAQMNTPTQVAFFHSAVLHSKAFHRLSWIPACPNYAHTHRD